MAEDSKVSEKNNGITPGVTTGEVVRFQKEKNQEKELEQSEAGNRFQGQPLRGYGSEKSVAPSRDAQTAASTEQRRKAQYLQSVLSGNLKKIRYSTIRTLKQFGANKAFYYLLPLVIVPPFIFGVLGLNILWLISSALKTPLKLWQKLVIALINIVILFVLAAFILSVIISICNAPGVQLGSEIASELDASSKYTFCKEFKISNWGTGGGSSGGAGATDTWTTAPALR